MCIAQCSVVDAYLDCNILLIFVYESLFICQMMSHIRSKRVLLYHIYIFVSSVTLHPYQPTILCTWGFPDSLPNGRFWRKPDRACCQRCLAAYFPLLVEINMKARLSMHVFVELCEIAVDKCVWPEYGSLFLILLGGKHGQPGQGILYYIAAIKINAFTGNTWTAWACQNWSLLFLAHIGGSLVEGPSFWCLITLLETTPLMFFLTK